MGKKETCCFLVDCFCPERDCFEKFSTAGTVGGLPSTNLLILFSFHFINERKNEKMRKKTTFWFDFKEGRRAFSSWATDRKGKNIFIGRNIQKCRRQQQKQREKQSRASTDSEEKVRDIIETKVMNAVGSGLIAIIIIIITTTGSNCFCAENLFHWPLKFVFVLFIFDPSAWGNTAASR